MLTPTEYEMKLLKPLWVAEQMSAADIHEASAKDTGWSYSSTRKTLDRMVEKKLLRIMDDSLRPRIYSTRVGKLETIAALSREFVRNMLDSPAPFPMTVFAHSRLVNAAELGALDVLLNSADAVQTASVSAACA